VQIGRSILILRDQRVILDAELAGIYGVETRGLEIRGTMFPLMRPSPIRKY